MELAILVRCLPMAGDRQDRIDLEVQGPVAIRHNVEFREAILDVNAVKSFLKQIDYWRTEKLEARFVRATLQAHVLGVQSDYQIHFVPSNTIQRVLESG